jgi:class 3 adenylate cyclase
MEDKPAPVGDVARSPVVRRLLALLIADVVSYSRLAGLDEEETVSRLPSLRVGIIDPCVVSYRGRIVNNAGDGFLASFDSPLDAVRCTIEFQHDGAAAEHRQPPDRKIEFRVGINTDQTIIESDEV